MLFPPFLIVTQSNPMNKPFYSVALLAAALLAGTIQADAQTVTKTKTKSAKRAATTTAAPTPPPPPGSGPDGPAGSGPDGPRPPRGPHGPDGHGPKGKHGPKGTGVQALTDLRATITSYVANNDEQVYDAFVLRPETGAVDTVRFPRHLGQ